MINKNFSLESSSQTTFYIDKSKGFGNLRELDLSKYVKFIIVIDRNISNQILRPIKELLNEYDKEIIIIELTPSEKNKGIEESVKLVETLENNNVGRFDLLISVGGGFVSDIASFVSSIYMRGIPYAAIPTTLIGQVDAVTAGKTCINGPKTKNLLGTFYLPVFVYNNINILKTLPVREMRQGWSEIFKYALLDSFKLIELMEEYFLTESSSTLVAIIEETIRIRLKIREVDPLSSNLGHTFGHAFERISDYKISHGDAIAIGTLMAIKFGEEVGVTKSGLHQQVLEKMENFALNTKFHEEFIPSEVANLMLKDKKSSSFEINLVLLKDITKPFYNKSSLFFSTSPDSIEAFLCSYFEEFSSRLDSNLYENLSK